MKSKIVKSKTMRQLSEMNNQELWQLFPIIISRYNPEWPDLYLIEKRFIEEVIGPSNIYRISHYGSTAIPGMYAKPTIDILLEVSEELKDEAIISKMESAGYIFSPQQENPAPHMMFLKGYTAEGFKGQVYHLHVRYPGDWDELYFRDYLIEDHQLAGEYGRLKLVLKERYQFNRDGYTEAKSEFIKKVTQTARLEFQGRYLPKQYDLQNTDQNERDKLNQERNWTVLLIGGASGTGKSSVAYQLAHLYHLNVLEVDDICQAVKAMTTREILPAIHYWSTGKNWMDIGVSGNVKWLIDVSKEMIPGLKAIVDNHLEADVPIIIEGDFIHPEWVASFDNPRVKSFYLYEPDKNQILQNYLAREGGDLQHFRADISTEYGDWLVSNCGKLGIKVIEARPWDIVIDRISENKL